MLDAGSRIGNYELISCIGEGGMGKVFLAKHVKLQRKVALKLLKSELNHKPEAVTRFFNEARAANMIGHEHIIDVTDFGTSTQGDNYFVMEWLSGESLGKRLKKEGRWPMDRVLHVAIQLADALAAAHMANIIHRDLKPDNVHLITRAGDPYYVKLLDFGIAKLLDDVDADVANRTRSGIMMGTPGHMSPEQCMGRRDIDHRADVYSYGVLLYQMVTGQLPFTSNNWTEVLIAHVEQPFPLAAKLRPDIDPRLEDIIQKCVKKRPEDRWQSMALVRDALKALQADLQQTGALADPALQPPADPTDAIHFAPPPVTTSDHRVGTLVDAATSVDHRISAADEPSAPNLGMMKNVLTMEPSVSRSAGDSGAWWDALHSNDDAASSREPSRRSPAGDRSAAAVGAGTTTRMPSVGDDHDAAGQARVYGGAGTSSHPRQFTTQELFLEVRDLPKPRNEADGRSATVMRSTSSAPAMPVEGSSKKTGVIIFLVLALLGLIVFFVTRS